MIHHLARNLWCGITLSRPGGRNREAILRTIIQFIVSPMPDVACATGNVIPAPLSSGVGCLSEEDDKVEFVAHYEQDEVVKRECCLAARTNSFCNPWPAGSGKLRVMKILI